MNGPVLPQNLDAERSVLGAVLLEPGVLTAVSPILTEDDFFPDTHRRIFRTMLEMSQRSVEIDLLTLKEEFSRNGNMEKAGGAGYLSSLLDAVPDVSNVEHYARIVKEKATARRLASVGQQLVRAAISQESGAGESARRTIEEILREVPAPAGAGARRSPLRSYTVAELHALAATRPPRELIVKPFMAWYESIFLYGYKGHGKTWPSLGAAMVCAQGEGGRFLNFEGVGPGVPTLFVDGEMFTTDLDQRAQDIKKSSPGLDPGDRLHIWTPDAQDDAHTILNLFSEEGRRMLEDHIEDIYDETGQTIGQIFFDNMASLLHGWQENEQESWGKIAPWLLQLRAQRRGNFWVHHAGKKLDYRGNSAMVGAMHAILKVVRPDDAAPGANFDLIYEYTRAKPVGLQNFNARLEGDVWTVETTGEVADELIRILTVQGLPLRAIADQIGKGKDAVARAQKRLGLRLPSGATGWEKE